MEEQEQPPPCENHVEIQHRDGKPPWCKSCGWNHGRPASPPIKIAARGTIPDGHTTPKIY